MTLAHLKLYDLVRTGDVFRFAYRERVFDATLARDGTLVDATTGVRYAAPTHFTDACVERVGAVKESTPAAYDRVWHVPSGQRINALRDALLRDVAGAVVDVRPVDVGTATARALAACSAVMHAPDANGRRPAYASLCREQQHEIIELRQLLGALVRVHPDVAAAYERECARLDHRPERRAPPVSSARAGAHDVASLASAALTDAQ